MISIDEPISLLPKTASTTLVKLKSNGIKTLFDLLNYFPNRYKDYRAVSKINSLSIKPDLFKADGSVEIITIRGKVIKSTNRYLRNSLTMQVVTIDDTTGQIDCVWFRQPYILTNIKNGMEVSVAGTLKQFGRNLQLSVDEYDVINPTLLPLSTCRLVPVYSEKRGLSTKTLRQKINVALDMIGDQIADPLPKEIITKNHLIDEKKAYKLIHFPNNPTDIDNAKRRLAFDELFTIQLSSKIIKKAWEAKNTGNKFKINESQAKIDKFINNLPFKLTSAQNRVVNEVLQDLDKTSPTNRLIQGDVGSGKTVIAVIAAYASYLSGFTTLIMAPTEILASQHYQTFLNLFKSENVSISLITGSVKGKKEDIIVGTHALINAKSKFDNVGLIIIDEQHKFGVIQRAMLKEKGQHPHLITMTATPIPRSVGLTLYGELDLSIIDQMPIGRKDIKTYLVPPVKRKDSYQWMDAQIKENGTQIFVVCPLIDESDHESMQSVKAASSEFDSLVKIFKNRRLALLHGRMKPKEKALIMEEFIKGTIDILVATQLVEVGVDIPNASIMVIEAAERYGLAQLHQLRGRVGRGEEQSYCLLFTTGEDHKTTERLEYFCTHSSGFKLAEYDLHHRGTGQIYGKRQHGTSDLVLASLTDTTLLEASRKSASEFFDKYNLSDYPLLEKKVEIKESKHITQD